MRVAYSLKFGFAILEEAHFIYHMKSRVEIIIPIYNEEDLLDELISQLKSVLESLEDYSCSVLLVDDGSHDRSPDIMALAAERYGWLRFVRLSRNFGHQAAISAGIAEAEADAYILMDGDLQDPPALIPELIKAWTVGAEVVLAERTSRKETPLRLFLMNLYHRYSGLLSDFKMPSNTGLYSLLSAEAMAAVRSMKERNRYFPGLREWIGFKTSRVYYDRDERYAGEPKQNYRRLIHLALDSIFCYSYLPLRMVTYVGTFISFVGFALALFFTARRLLGIEVAQLGFTTIIVLMTVLGGFQLIALGIFGEYLARAYDETKGRPLFIIEKRSGRPRE